MPTFEYIGTNAADKIYKGLKSLEIYWELTINQQTKSCESNIDYDIPGQ